MTTPQRDTIYIDVDDEITAVIEKVHASRSRVVALVLPKRATVFQSIVNMKLLKRAAAESRKNVVLITSESALLPMAGAVGLHVAQSLQTKPVIPPGPGAPDSTVVDAGDTDNAATDSDEPALDKNRSVGELAGLPTTNDDETIEVDNDPPPAKKPAARSKKAFNRKLAVPNFELFRTRFFLIGLGVVVVGIAWLFGFYILPKATVTIVTNNSTINTAVELTAATDAKEVDAEASIVPAVVKEYKQTDTQKAPATGKKDVGTPAKGKVTLSLDDCTRPQVEVPSGTGVSAAGQDFITQTDITLTSVKFGSQCRNQDFKEVSTGTVEVVAKSAGESANIEAQSYDVAGFSNVSGYGSDMTGGTSKIITIVSQTDIDTAKQKIIDQAKAAGREEVMKMLEQEGFIALDDTLKEADPLVTASPNVDDEASEVTVTVAVVYKMTGVQRDGLRELVNAAIEEQIDGKQQTILNDGLDNAAIRIEGQPQSDAIKLTVKVDALTGVQQDADDIKQFVIGKKKGEAIDLLKQRSGVQDARIKYNLPWIYTTPNSAKKIDVVFEKTDEAAN
ncbi:hypothetical protein CR970_03400 [Candidatus Saccharibacteria bacterium]|nr:MAG: hypothetical protein CR970_03400 [Candidatus Saccharibacteria bacterium]